MATLIDVVPSQAHVDERLARALALRPTALAPSTLSIDELLATLHVHYLPALRVAPRGLERLCLARTLREIHGGETHPATVDALLRALEGLRRAGLDADALDRAERELPADDAPAHARLATLREALRALDVALNDSGFVAASALESRLAQCIERAGAAETLPAPLDARACIVRFVSAAGVDPARVALVTALARALAPLGGRVEVHVLCEPRRERTPPSVDRALRALEDLDGLPVELSLGLREPEAPPPDSALESLLEALAAGGRCESAPVSLADAHGPDEEARWVAARVEHWLAEGYAPHEIAVVLRETTPEACAPVFRALDDARIPWVAQASTPLLHSPVARTLVALPAIAARGALRDEVLTAHAILGGNACSLSGAAPLHRVAHAMRQYGVESLFDPDLDARMREPRRGAPEPVVREALALRDAIRALLPPADARTHCARLRAYSARLSGEGRYRAESHAVMASAGYDPGARAILRAIGRDEGALRGVADLLDELPALLDSAGTRGTITLDEFAEALFAAAQERTLPAQPGHAGGVSVLSARAAAGRSVRAVAVVGVNDGGFPAYTQDDPYVGDAERRAILRATGRFLDRPHGREEETLLFLSALACATDALALSAARHDAGGRALPPSPFMVDARRALGVRPAHVRHDPLARSREVPPRGVERAMRALAQRSPSDAGGAVLLLPALGSVRARTVIEAERREFFAGTLGAPGPYSGRVDHDPRALELLDLRGYGSARRPVDVTTLERAARCGFKAFAEEILGLSAPIEPAVTLDATERGHLLHALVEAGQHALAKSRGLGREAQLARVATALDAAGEEFLLREPCADADLLRADLLAIRRQVSAWLSRRMEVQDRWEMLATEVTFGPQKKWPALEVPVDGGEPIVIKGRIDGVEAMDGGVRVVEFKSGRGDGFRKRLREGALDTQFQLVVYAAALSRASEHGAMRGNGPVDGLYVGFRDQSEHGLRDVLSRVTDENGEKAFDVDAIVSQGARGQGALADAVRRAILPMRDGLFPARPRDCDFCNASSLCRIENAGGAGDE